MTLRRPFAALISLAACLVASACDSSPTRDPAQATPELAALRPAAPVDGSYGALLSADDVRDIAARIERREEPWTTAFRALLARADRALDAKPESVTFQGDSGHLFFTEPPYCGWSRRDGGPDCRDGQINPDADRGDYLAANRLGQQTRHLAIAYVLTGEPRYADKAVELIRTWMLDSATYMEPRLSNWQSWIELYITIPSAIYAVDLLRDAPNWRDGELAAAMDWIRAFSGDARKLSHENNFENWRLVLLSTAGATLGDQGLLDEAFARFRAIIPDQIDTDGTMIEEIGRTKSLSYSLYALNAMMITAEVARRRGIDLYRWRTDDGRGLDMAMAYHAPYAIDPTNWPYPQMGPVRASDNMAMFELAYAVYGDPVYLRAVEAWGRPMDEIRVLGPTTLTHSRRE
ncbi:alginate lyase family protein [Marinivivus vitaminiproducens]|uniref:alginate lyase family protein n=1 Tax=Marinivivus vitaminiproducens TaxID=3035935 RepID=UPI0027A82697|nr:alginate lyase family protein [Geminicoccaceae bacterium SCSIO 64248]